MGFFQNTGESPDVRLKRFINKLSCSSQLFHSDLDYFIYVYHQFFNKENCEIKKYDLVKREIYVSSETSKIVKIGLFNELVSTNETSLKNQYKEIIDEFLNNSKKELDKRKIDIYIAAIITEGQPGVSPGQPKVIQANERTEFHIDADKNRIYRIVMESNSDIKETKSH